MQLVDVPALFPSACSCGNQKGPLVDTHREVAGLHQYVCLNCAKAYANLFGLVSWKDAEEKADVATQIARLEYELSNVEKKLREERDESELKDRAIDKLKVELEKANARIAHLEELRRRTAAEALA